ncbi:hypothetical protein AB0L70_35865 [Kribbella sp. NPDC051952]|uniref:hypothetical protein n=1 Tax=Kribbella sp. NPDC051952 TaxID=3154851 RepID=UPI003420DA9A
MTVSPDVVLTAGPTCGDVAVAVNPFRSNHYHFGMLLGVDDLEADQGYHRGKTWLHNAWLHGAGTVWGLEVSLRAERREMVVAPGLALTSAGREVYLDQENCVDIGRWLDELAPDTLSITVDGDQRRFVVHIIASPRQCLERPVPSIAEPCAGASTETAYSRSTETARLEIRPNVPDPAPVDYPALRAFLGLIPVDDAELATAVADAYAAIAARPPAEQGAATVRWLNRFATRDALARTPDEPGATFPVPDDAGVLLATVSVTLAGSGDAAVLVVDGANPSAVDQHDRPVLVPTSVVQELAAAATSPGSPVPSVEGPRADPDSATLTGAEFRFAVDATLDPLTVVPAAFTVTTLGAGGWTPVGVTTAATENADTTVVLTLDAVDAGQPVRVIGAGTGPNPLLGADGRLVAGVRGGPPASIHDGHDIVLMVRN